MQAFPATLAAVMCACALVSACGDTSHAAPGHDAHAKPAAKQAEVPVAHVDDLPSKADIAALFEEWNVTLQTGSPHDMAALYAEDGVLLPTVSNDVRSNRMEIAEYFEHFQRLRPRGTINEQHIDVLDRNTAVNSGIYTFDIVREGRADFVVARYSFVYEKINGKWRIVSHHSSAMPQAVDERPLALSAVLGNAASPASAAPAKAADKPAEKSAPKKDDHH
jgi:uncharacterized protein (TIGR02246 family)